MKKRIIYLDNAATTCPKPEEVYRVQDEYSRRCANPGRGAHTLALDSAKTIFQTRTAAAELLGIRQPERLVFTPGCTYSVNTALMGLTWNAGDTVVVSAFEHNAVMRPLARLQRLYGIRVETVPYDKKGVVDMRAFIKILLDNHPRLCVFTEASNVTGEQMDLASIATICSAHKVPLMIDAAQTAGRAPARIDDLGISIWCASGHKGLYGMPGVGLLYVHPAVELQPLVSGGTGSNSSQFEMPSDYPDHLESGTLPGPAIASLGAGIQWLQKQGIKAVADAEDALTQTFLDWAQRTQSVRVFGNRAEGRGIPVVSFDMPGVPCDRVAALLDNEFGIAVRSGLHCSPAAHQTLGTLDTGLVRVSFSYFNTPADVQALCAALEAIKSRKDVSATV
jgi:cysteine desulfurase/selenocysteine lyase